MSRRMRLKIEEGLRRAGWREFRDGTPPERCLIADDGTLRLEVYYDRGGAGVVEYRHMDRPRVSEMVLFGEDLAPGELAFFTPETIARALGP